MPDSREGSKNRIPVVLCAAGVISRFKVDQCRAFPLLGSQMR
jgi:hypothetical protein